MARSKIAHSPVVMGFTIDIGVPILVNTLKVKAGEELIVAESPVEAPAAQAPPASRPSRVQTKAAAAKAPAAGAPATKRQKKA